MVLSMNNLFKMTIAAVIGSLSLNAAENCPTFNQFEKNSEIPSVQCAEIRADDSLLEPSQEVRSKRQRRFTPEEDELLRKLINKEKSWQKISEIMGRTARQVRERWFRRTDPQLKKGDWEPWEDYLILKNQKVFGNKWALIAEVLPNRSDVSVRDRFKVLKKSKKMSRR